MQGEKKQGIKGVFKDDMGEPDGKVAIITGATSGIGEKIAEVFVAEGAKTVLAGRCTAEKVIPCWRRMRR